jgi:hypothetical protein
MRCLKGKKEKRSQMKKIKVGRAAGSAQGNILYQSRYQINLVPCNDWLE